MSAKPKPTFADFEAFWPYYLNEHADPRNRQLHFFGTGAAIATLVTGVVTLNPVLLAMLPVVGYGPAWIGHYLIEKNRPATFIHPLWSLRGDLRMFRLTLTGQLQAHIERARATA